MYEQHQISKQNQVFMNQKIVSIKQILNQLLAQLQAGRRRGKNQPESCQQIVQNVQLMVSALPNDLRQVFAIASTLGEQTNQWKQDSDKLRDVMTCSVDQLSFLRNQRDRLQSQLDLS